MNKVLSMVTSNNKKAIPHYSHYLAILAVLAHTMAESDQQQRIRVRFVTKFDEYRVTDVAISVPLKLNRAGLSEVVHHLLGTESTEDEPRPFDFKINDLLLRESLQSFMKKQLMNTEEVMEI